MSDDYTKYYRIKKDEDEFWSAMKLATNTRELVLEHLREGGYQVEEVSVDDFVALQMEIEDREVEAAL